MMKTRPGLISVIIPARNEADSLKRLIPMTQESLSSYPYEIIVINDGSTDGTREVCRGNGTIVISHEKTLGKGAAMRTGVEHAHGEVIIFLDGDGAHDPRDILPLARAVLQGEADLVIGSRALPDSRVPNSPFIRRLSNNLASWVISVIISFMLPLATLFRCPVRWRRIADGTSGFRALKKDSWRRLALTSEGFEIETEMIYEAARQGLTIAETPISCNWNSDLSHLSVLRDGAKTLKLILTKLRGNIRENRANREIITNVKQKADVYLVRAKGWPRKP